MALATCRPAPVAGESLNRPDESKLSSGRFLLPPLVVLRTPCADCIGVPRKCYWTLKSDAMISNNWAEQFSKRLLLKENLMNEMSLIRGHLILYLPLNTQNNRASSFFLHFFPKQRLVQLRRRFQHAAPLRAFGNHLPQRAIWIAPQRGDKITPGSARHIEAGL